MEATVGSFLTIQHIPKESTVILFKSEISEKRQK